MAEEFAFLNDVDGNFVEQFQTTGFDARLWELFLQAYLRNAGFVVTRPRPAPDFLATRDGITCAIEATTANADPLGDDVRLRPDSPRAEFRQYYVERLLNAYPIRIGSPLFSKLRRGYWSFPEVAGRPFVLALGDLSGWGVGAGAALPIYLYGLHSYWAVDQDNRVMVVVEDLSKHQVGKKEVPSGFFRQEGAENISAVLFSCTGTVSKFNRLAVQQGYAEKDVVMLHGGLRYDHAADAVGPIGFCYNVAEREAPEPWGEGVSLFHNPYAIHKMPLGVFPAVAEHELIDGVPQSHIPDFHPLASKTVIMQVTDR